MCVPRTGRWRDSLRQTLRRVYEPTTRMPVPWFLSGDAALALQGVDVEPECVEFRAISPYAVAYFAGFMKPYEAPANMATIVYRRGGNLVPSDSWRSNIHQRVVAWSVGGRATWLGRWHIERDTVQTSYVRSIYPDPIGAATRANIKRAHFEGMQVPVVPLEFLLADSALRNQTHLTHRILHAMRVSGHDPDNMRAALELMPPDKSFRLRRLLEIGPVAKQL